MPRSIDFYDRRAAHSHDTGGFAPERKHRLVEATLTLLLALTEPGGTLLELGAGTGAFTDRILQTNHFALIHVTDGSPNMLALAGDRLRLERAATQFADLDFTTYWADRYQGKGVDAVTSTMALHHSPDKRALFRQVLAVLKPGGTFVFGDHVDGATPRVQDLLDRARAMIRLRNGGEATEAQIQATMQEVRERGQFEGDHCESVSAIIGHLENSGFVDVDCLWRDYWLAVFVSRRPN